MTIKVTVGETDKQSPAEAEKSSPVVATVKMKMRRAMNGDIMIFDHADIDVVISPTTSKIVAFSKESLMAGVERDSFRIALINMSKWIDEERPYFEFMEKYDDIAVDRFVDPDEESSTELGEVPHENEKGVLRPGYNYGPYWQNYTY